MRAAMGLAAVSRESFSRPVSRQKEWSMASRLGVATVLGSAVALALATAVRAEEAPTLTLNPQMLQLDAVAAPAVGDGGAWIDKMKNPCKEFNWGADQRMREEYFNNAITLNQQARGHEWQFERFRTRLWGTIKPCDEFEVYTRMAWEARHWWNPQSKEEWQNNEVFFDNLYGKLKLAPIHTTFTVGRQDIILGDGWLVLEGTPLDGSTSIYFDAARSTTELKDIQTTLDLIYINQYSDPDKWLPTMGVVGDPQIEQDERGAIVWAANKSIKNLEVDGYFIYKNDHKVLANGDQGDIYTPGVRLVEDFNEHLRGRIEGAGQFGERNGATVRAFGLNSRLSYSFNDAYKQQVRLSWEYLSGDTPGTSTNEAFDPLWGRWPQWSELYVYTYAAETRIAETTNLDRVGVGYQVYPTDKMQIDLDCNALFANENTRRGSAGFSDHGNYRGQLFTSVLRYKFNKYLAGHLWAEYLLPGDYYKSPADSNAVYLRAELVFGF